MLGTSKQYASNISNDGKKVGDKVLDKILMLFPDVNPVWLKMGNGNMLKNISDNTDIENFPKTNYRMIPLLNLDVVGGASNQEMDTAEYVEKYVPFLDAQNGDICCPVTNNSMSPVYTPGTLVQLRKIERWRDYVEYGQVYVVDLIDGRRLIKQVKKSEKKNTFVLHSYNNEYDDNDIPVNMIYSMWLVIAKYEKMVM
ncbi:MAG: helix-turn-helix transcriptional regulator [Bacteroides xylanisolvens]